jgi:hypothetical protein
MLKFVGVGRNPKSLEATRIFVGVKKDARENVRK